MSGEGSLEVGSYLEVKAQGRSVGSTRGGCCTQQSAGGFEGFLQLGSARILCPAEQSWPGFKVNALLLSSCVTYGHIA
jgi:hypothetical protein